MPAYFDSTMRLFISVGLPSGASGSLVATICFSEHIFAIAFQRPRGLNQNCKIVYATRVRVRRKHQSRGLWSFHDLLLFSSSTQGAQKQLDAFSKFASKNQYIVNLLTTKYKVFGKKCVNGE